MSYQPLTPQQASEADQLEAMGAAMKTKTERLVQVTAAFKADPSNTALSQELQALRLEVQADARALRERAAAAAAAAQPRTLLVQNSQGYACPSCCGGSVVVVLCVCVTSTLT